MELNNKILSDVTIFTKYSRYLPEVKRRETWEELVTRNMGMHIKKFPSLEDEIRQNYDLVFDKKVLPSMRSLQFGGKPIEISPNRLYNCAYSPVDHWKVFGEIMFLLLGGSGVGYSVQYHHVDQLPHITKPLQRNRRHLIQDSIEGWADAVKTLMKAYFFGLSNPVFDYSDIRSRGTLLKTSGGKAPGPAPLRLCLTQIREVLEAKNAGDKLRPIEVHDIMCYIADAVLAGGIRRAALACLFSFDDMDMLTCKFGDWNDHHPQRGRANNSAVLLRHRIKKKDFLKLWDMIKESGSGEPGFVFSNNMDYGFNPCYEIALRANQFCNLTTTNVSDVSSQEDLLRRVKTAAFIGTLQASYTDFHYLREIWRRTTEKEALIGVSMTGIATGPVLNLDLQEAAQTVVEENRRVAGLIGINPAARTTAIKPEGTGSLVLGGVSPGVHGWWDSGHYIKRMEFLKYEPICEYLTKELPDLMEDDIRKPHLQSKLSIPIKTPKDVITRHESALSFLERIKKFHAEWVRPGHISGDNTHNVSATVYIKDNEWEDVGQWMWKNRESYSALSVLPFDGGTYKQTPFETISEDDYNRLTDHLKKIDLTQIIETEDNTTLKEQAACAGGACEI